MASFLSGLMGSSNPLQADLKRVTSADVCDSPKEEMEKICRASFMPDDRKTIMLHLQSCFADTSGKQWRRVFGALLLLENLVRKGSPAVVRELADGIHFDIVQRLTFLGHFEFASDKRVEALVREKAKTLRTDLLERMQRDQPVEDSTSQLISLNASPSSPSSHGAESKEEGKQRPPPPPPSQQPMSWAPNPSNWLPKDQNRVLVNGLVSVGHNEDTTDEESGGEDSRSSKRRSPKGQTASQSSSGQRNASNRKVLEESTSSSDSDSEKRRRGGGGYKPKVQPRPPAPTNTETLDLLDLSDPAPSPAPAAESRGGEASVNLLDF